MTGRRRSASLALIAALLACSAPDEATARKEPRALPEMALMGTIPIYWGETGGFDELLGGKGNPHWARARLERDYRLAPLDVLDARTLADFDFLFMAQPRALAPAENVALDAWVRQGGRLLLLADPQMTGASRFDVGDKRRPQDVTLLTPILAHWGLSLEYEEDQAPGYGAREAAGTALPVNLPGRFVATTGQEGANCRLSGQGVLARCKVGAGEATVLADAAILDLQGPRASSSAALDWLVEQAFAERREIAGQPRRAAADKEPKSTIAS